MKLLAVVLLLSAFSSLSLTEVMKNLNQWKSLDKCGQFFTPNPKKQDDVIVPTGFTESQYKMICQRWKNEYRFATLYDTKSRIPVYSAYTYYKDSEDRKLNHYYWKIEPQLDNIQVPDGTNAKDMIDPKDVEKKGYIIHQAVDSDYTENYTRGHLFPRSYAADKDQGVSTFTLTNIAPQIRSSNEKWAVEVEIPMRTYIKNSCSLGENQKAYIVTGVVPGTQWLSILRGKKHEIKNGINVPSYYWTAFCCTSKNNNKLIGTGCVATMNSFTAEKTSINDLNTQLPKLYGKKFKVFPGLTVENIKPLKTPFCSATAD